MVDRALTPHYILEHSQNLSSQAVVVEFRVFEVNYISNHFFESWATVYTDLRLRRRRGSACAVRTCW